MGLVGQDGQLHTQVRESLQEILYGALGLFCVMSLWVIVFGYRDIQRMFAALREGRDEHDA